MSLRLRLTLLYSAILALTLAAFSGVLYVTLAQVTFRAVEDALVEEATRLINAKQFRLDEIVLPASKFAAPETYVQTRSLDGTLTDRTANLGGVVLPLSNEVLRAVLNGQTATETTVVENRRVLIYSKPVTVEGRPVGIVQVARSLAEQDESLGTLRFMLLVGASAVCILAFGAGWLMAGAALRPINRITQTAQAIGAERDFDRRVAYRGANDEVGRLATTFNAMLAELQAVYWQVKQALQAQRRFVADASHELRTPLTTIRGNIALLQREPPISPEDRAAVLTDLAGECDRLIRLVNNLLVLARADAGQPLRRDVVDLEPLVHDVCRQARLLAPDRAIVCAEPIGGTIVGDRDALKQVLLILLDNAVRHTPPDGLITITTAVEGERTLLSVRDTGPGIPPDVLPHIFERFYRADASRTGTGTGLGLAIAKALVEAQQGTLSVESVVGQGTTFTVSLPRSPVDDGPPRAARTAATAAA
jgi:two-component system OmpR family sensor kinase